MKKSNCNPPPERWDLVDRNRIPTGQTRRRGEKAPPGIYHIVVLGWVINRKGEFLISRRSPEKSNPLLWETTGGAKQAGEDSLKAVVREIREEVGIDVPKTVRFFWEHGKDLTGFSLTDGCFSKMFRRNPLPYSRKKPVTQNG